MATRTRTSLPYIFAAACRGAAYDIALPYHHSSFLLRRLATCTVLHAFFALSITANLPSLPLVGCCNDANNHLPRLCLLRTSSLRLNTIAFFAGAMRMTATAGMGGCRRHRRGRWQQHHHQGADNGLANI